MTRSRLLTTAEVVGVRPGDGPLTADDITTMAGRFYAGQLDRITPDGQWPDGEQQRPVMFGRAGRLYPDRPDVGLSCMSDAAGIWTRLTGRGEHGQAWARSGHVPWARAERAAVALATVRRGTAEPEQLDLFAEASS